MKKQDNLNLDLDAKKLELECEKLKLELEKLRVERFKAWSTAISIGIPLLAVAITVIFGYWSEKQRADTEFQIKAADIITRFQDPFEMKGRARILRTLFPVMLPADFGEKFDDQRFAVPTPPDETLLLRLIVEHQDQKQEIIKMWKQIYPHETRVDNLE